MKYLAVGRWQSNSFVCAHRRRSWSEQRISHQARRIRRLGVPNRMPAWAVRWYKLAEWHEGYWGGGWHVLPVCMVRRWRTV